MSPNSWAEPDGMIPQGQPSAHADQLDRQMIRHLLAKYSKDGLAQLLQEEDHSPLAHADTASILTSSTYSSVKSEDAPSLFDSGSSIRSIRSLPNTSSSRSSIISNVSARTAKLLGRKSQPNLSAHAQVEDGSWDTENESATQAGETGSIHSTGAVKQKGTFMCGFCKEEGIQKTCTRKNDLKRHIEDFHNMNAQWFCRHRGCQMVFDWQTAYKTHLKQCHGGSRMSLDEAKVLLCPQTVFACGFENCMQVFESPSDDDAATTFKEYVAHVVKHFDEGANSGEWTYSARIRNLLRQSGVLRAWTNSAWPEADRNRLQWMPQSSGILRKRLETRHIGDLQLLIQYAIALGSEPTSVQKYREDFITPILSECQMNIHGHKISPQPAVMSQPPASDSEFQFKISRGNNPNLAAYMASQRRIYTPRAPVRSGRSARPPMRTMGTGPSNPSQIAPGAAPQFSFNLGQGSQIYDPRHSQHQQPPHHHPQQQHPQHQQYSMVPQVSGGGMVAEDIRSFQTMTSVGSSEPDLDMTDAQMMDTGYGAPQQHDFSSPYGQGGLQSSPMGGQNDLTPTLDQQQPHQYGAYAAAGY